MSMSKDDGAAVGGGTAAIVGADAQTMRPFADVFGFGAKEGLNSNVHDPRPIMVTVLSDPADPAHAALIPGVDPNYVFPLEATKTLVIGLELNFNVYLKGEAGVGKSTLVEQVCALTNRPMLRVQHSESIEEAHILGQWTVRGTPTGPQTEYQLGPLPTAMAAGLVYLMDEADFALPSVMAVYQAVLEHKPLVIPEAPLTLRVTRPHPNFRVVGTGNTNGTGDTDGRYQGTRMQNVANFSRWTIMEEVGYMAPAVEAKVLMGQAGITAAVARRFVEFARAVRQAAAAGKIGFAIGPRELISSAIIGVVRGGDYRAGLRSGFSNRCTAVDRLVVDQIAMRIFGV